MTLKIEVQDDGKGKRESHSVLLTFDESGSGAPPNSDGSFRLSLHVEGLGATSNEASAAVANGLLTLIKELQRNPEIHKLVLGANLRRDDA